MKRWLTMGVVMLVLALAVGGCAGEKPQQEAVNLELYPTGAIGTGSYQIALAISGMINDMHPWFRASVIESTGSTDAVHAADAASPERRKNGFLISHLSQDAVKSLIGEPPYKRKFDDLRWVATTTPVGFGFGTFDPEIRTPQDLVGKRVGIFPKGSGTITWSDALLKDAWGIYDKVRLSHHSPMDFKDLLITGTNDANFFITIEPVGNGKWIMSPYCALTVAAKQTYWLSVSGEDIAKMNQLHPWTATLFIVSKGGPGENTPPEDTGVIVSVPSIMTWDNADEGIVYELVKFLDENAQEYSRRLQGRQMGIASQMPQLPPGIGEDLVHPGARRYYDEHNVKIGPWEAP